MSKKNNIESGEKLSDSNIEKRLDAIISILLTPEISNETQLKKIGFLSKSSFTNSEIASILHTSLQSLESQKYRKPKVKK